MNPTKNWRNSGAPEGQAVPTPLVWNNTKLTRRVWGYQRGNQNPYIEEEQTTQWPKEKGQTMIYKTYI